MYWFFRVRSEICIRQANLCIGPFNKRTGPFLLSLFTLNNFACAARLNRQLGEWYFFFGVLELLPYAHNDIRNRIEQLVVSSDEPSVYAELKRLIATPFNQNDADRIMRQPPQSNSSTVWIRIDRFSSLSTLRRYSRLPFYFRLTPPAR